MKNLIKNFLLFLGIFLIIAAVFSAFSSDTVKSKSVGIEALVAGINQANISEIVVSEDLGFFNKGKGGLAVEEGKTSIESGEIPINTSGGLKSKGHPVGATGIAQIIEVYEQLTGQAGKRQVKNARIGLAQNMGGSGASCTINILEAI